MMRLDPNYTDVGLLSYFFVWLIVKDWKKAII